MAKPDGRIEKGQRLGSAISARAWNRAQDAADIVLGVRPGVEAGQQLAQSIDHVVVRISQNYPRVSQTPIEVGHGIALPLMAFAAGTLATQSTNPVALSSTVTVTDAESDLPAYDSYGIPVITLAGSTPETFIGSRCGIIESVSSLADGFYTCRVRVRGIARCRVLLLQSGNAVSPPPPYPSDSDLQPFWRRYLTATDYGQGAILATGARYRMRGRSFGFPAIAEALVMLG
jgi:hypothetical protein